MHERGLLKVGEESDSGAGRLHCGTVTQKSPFRAMEWQNGWKKRVRLLFTSSYHRPVVPQTLPAPP